MTMADMSLTEVRRDERARAFLRARIIFNNHNTTVDCIIKNISASGAKIDVSGSLSIPAEFDLDVPQRGRTYRARMMWRDTNSMGVVFIEARSEERVGMDPQIERLAQENRKLKATVAALTKRLEDLGQDVNVSLVF